MRLDRFTQSFQVAISDAQSLALGKDHQFIEPSHLMMSLLNQNPSTVISLFKSAGVNVHSLRSQLNKTLDSLAQVEGVGGEVQSAPECCFWQAQPQAPAAGLVPTGPAPHH